MQVLINQDNLDKRVHPDANEYKNRIEEYIKDLSRPITVHGILAHTGHDDKKDIEGVGISYYLVELVDLRNGEEGPASYGWARRRVNSGTHTWEPYSSHIAKTLDEFEKLEQFTPCYWLPVFYTRPLANKHVKSMLTKFDD
jgi:hypothetical protein